MNRQERADRAWLRAAMAFGKSMSKDPERRVGACVVSSDGMLVSFGYNGLPSGTPDTAAVWGDKALKNAIVKHAEENAVAKAPFRLAGATCYCTLKPCQQCLGTVVNAGCARMVWLDDRKPWAYRDDAAFMLVATSSGIALTEYEMTAGDTALSWLLDGIATGGPEGER